MDKQKELKDLLSELNISEDTFQKISDHIKGNLENIYEKAEEYAELKAKEASEVAVATALAEQEEKHQKEIENLYEKAEEYAEYVKGEMVENVQGYVDHIVEKFVSENEDRFKLLEDYERMKDTFEHIKESFEKNGYKIDENAQLTELKTELDEAKASYNDLFAENIEFKNEITEMKKILIYESKTKDLTETQRQKINTLIEKTNIDEDCETFSTKLQSLIESVSFDKEEPKEKEPIFEQHYDDKMKKYLEKL